MTAEVQAPAFDASQRHPLRAQMRAALEKINTDGAPDAAGDVYVPLLHMQALDPDRMVVEGMRGAGKSFWTGVLTDPGLLTDLLGSQTLGPNLRDALKKITRSRAIALDRPGAQSNFPSAGELPRLLTLPGVTPETVWRVAVVSLFDADPALGMPGPGDDYDRWQAPIAWAGQNPGRIAHALDKLDQRFAAANETAWVIFDALDRVSYELTQVSQMTAGLLRVMLDLRFARGLRLKAFIREDLLAQAGAALVDGAKLLNNKATLLWKQDDLYGLAFYRIAQHAPLFRAESARVADFDWAPAASGQYQCSQARDSGGQKRLWCALVGDYMGGTATRGHSYPYIYNHLGDGLARVAPRTFLTALRAALASASDQYATRPHVIHHEAIRDGVRAASGARVAELREEYQWIAPALQCIKAQQKTVPMDKSELEKVWRHDDASVLQAIEGMRGTALVPWRSDAPTQEKIERLLATLEQIGIVKARRNDGGERIDLPDIYRLAYQIGRRGGIATQNRA